MIQIHVVHSAVVPSDIQVGVRGSYAADTLRFYFTPEWNGLTKKLIFFPQRGAPVFCVYEDGDEVVIPYRVMKCAGNNTFILSGYSLTENDQIAKKVITATGILYVSPAPSDTLLEPDIPEATVFEEIVAKLGAPYVGENGDWYEWDPDTRDFVDTGTPARGPKGDTGRGLVILGKYASVEALEEAVTDPEVGDAYDVGTDTLYTYIWDGAEWVSHGDIRGVGVESVEQISVSTESGGVNVIRVTLTDGTYTDFEVRNGAKGAKGDPGNVYYGTGTPPDDAVIWINPAGEDSPVEQVLQARDDAQSAANAASGYATNAYGYANAANASKNSANDYKNKADGFAQKAEQWATGGASGTPSATNNAQYYATQASGSASAAGVYKTGAETAARTAQQWATGGSSGTPTATNNAKYYSDGAATSESNASISASAADDSAEDAEAYAIGTRNGESVSSDDPAYHNNAKYYADAAQAAKTAAEAAADAAQNTVYLTDNDDGDTRYTMAWGVRGGYPVLTLTPIEEA